MLWSNVGRAESDVSKLQIPFIFKQPQQQQKQQVKCIFKKLLPIMTINRFIWPKMPPYLISFSISFPHFTFYPVVSI